MAKAKYTGAYLALRRAYAPVVARGEAVCSEPVCVMQSRHIVPGSRWHLSHDETGTVVLGPSHAKCNLSEAAKRGNAARAPRFLRL